MTVNQAALREWYLALKSGGYSQGEEYLSSSGKFCCWGVACELTPGLPQADHDEPGPVRGWVVYGQELASALPPQEVTDRLGISARERVIVSKHIVKQYFSPEEYGEALTLTRLNDMGVPFDTIADIIWDNYGEGDPPSTQY